MLQLRVLTLAAMLPFFWAVFLVITSLFIEAIQCFPECHWLGELELVLSNSLQYILVATSVIYFLLCTLLLLVRCQAAFLCSSSICTLSKDKV